TGLISIPDSVSRPSSAVAMLGHRKRRRADDLGAAAWPRLQGGEARLVGKALRSEIRAEDRVVEGLVGRGTRGIVSEDERIPAGAAGSDLTGLQEGREVDDVAVEQR